MKLTAVRAIFRARLDHSLLLFVLLLYTASAVAQNPAPLALPDLKLKVAGQVNAMARQADGSVIIAGGFTSINGIPRSNLARLTPEGRLDDSWNPSADASVTAITIGPAPDHPVYVAGFFGRVGGLDRDGIAKLSASDGAADPDWEAPFSGINLRVLAADSGSLYVGGFLLVNGSARYLAKLRADNGAQDPGWAAVAGPDNAVFALALYGQMVYVGGGFDKVGGISRPNLARIFASGPNAGTLDIDWNAAADGTVFHLVDDGAGSLYASGFFDHLGGAERPRLAKLDIDSAVADTNWLPDDPNDSVAALAVMDDAVYLGGAFTRIGDEIRQGVAKLSANDAALDPGWSPSIDTQAGGVQAIAALGNDGLVMLGGFFSQAGGALHLGLATVDALGEIGDRIDAELPGAVVAVGVQSDGLIIGGTFLTADGEPRRNLLRVNGDGMLDPVWKADVEPGPSGAAVEALVIDSNDQVYVGGGFETVNGEQAPYLAKLSGDTGERDTSWGPDPGQDVLALAIDADDNLYVGGNFSLIDSEAREGVARFDGSGALDDWAPRPGFGVSAFAFDGNLSVYLGGVEAGGTRGRIVKVAIDSGAIDPGWTTSNAPAPGLPSVLINALAVGDAGAVFVGGEFGSVDGEQRLGLAKLTANGVLDPLWNPGSEEVWSVDALLMDGSGAMYVGGAFAELGGLARDNLAKLSQASGAALTSWNPGASSDVNILAFTPDGAIAVGGDFSTIGAARRDALAVLPVGIFAIFADGFER